LIVHSNRPGCVKKVSRFFDEKSWVDWQDANSFNGFK
jgi:hypothetical protein